MPRASTYGLDGATLAAVKRARTGAFVPGDVRVDLLELDEG
jgi:hypothetical protein